MLATDVGQNVIYVGEGDAHPGLYRKALFMQGAELVVCDEGGYLLFDEPQRGVTPGQFAVWYDGETLVGSGVIDR